MVTSDEPSGAPLYRFSSGLELDGERRELRLHGRVIPLERRAFDLLTYLIRHRERVVRTAELVGAVWPDPAATDEPLRQAVQRIRAALREGGVDDAIRAYARGGYRFSAEVDTTLDRPEHDRLPYPSTTFIGRAEEVRGILSMLGERGCRLLTLTGPGGVGKTRLALEVAHQARDQLALSVDFVDLQPIRSAELVAAAIAEAAGLVLQGSERPREQLIRFLQRGRRLIVLDTMEHLTDSAELVAEMLSRAPGVQVLVTSRELLGLDEWVYQVEPLPLSDESANGDAPAASLFIDRAQRARRDFDAEAEGAQIAQVCRLVGGLPLAIELAAAWTSALTCAQIAAEVERNIDFLASTRRDIPERHRSMTAVFEYSWSRLEEAEQAVLARLSVFHGEFTYEAAASVAGADARVLLALVQKSLLRARGAGRYHLHELVRQYGEERLAARDEHAETRARHGGWFLDLLAAALPGLGGADQAGTLARLEGEIGNIRAAWRWAVERRAFSGRADAIHALGVFYLARSRFSEGSAACHAAVTALEGEDWQRERMAALASALCEAGWCDLRQGRFDQSWRSFRRSAALIRDYDLDYPDGQDSDPVLGLASFAYGRGDMARCEELAQGVLQRAIEVDRRANQYAALSLLGRVARYDRRLDEAKGHHARAHELVLRARDDWYRGRIVYELGMTALEAGDRVTARRYFESILATVEDPHVVANAINGLGTLTLAMGANDEAARYFSDVAARFRELGEDLGVIDTLHGLGRALIRLGRPGEAAGALREGIALASAAQMGPLTVTLLVDASELFLSVGRPQRAAELLGFARTQQTWASREHGDVPRNLQKAASVLSPEELAACLRAGERYMLGEVVSAVLAELVAIDGYQEEDSYLPPENQQAPTADTNADPERTSQRTVRVLVVDAHEIMREGLVRLLGDTEGIEVAGEAATGEDALARAAALRPDVVLLDFILPDIDGIEVARRLLAAGRPVQVLMLTSISDEQRVREAIEAGVIGYLLKDVGTAELVQAIELAADGRPALHSTVRNYLLKFASPPPQPAPFPALSERDRELMRLLARGASNRQIAEAMGLTYGTVKVYISGLLTKLGVPDRTHAALLAVQHGLHEPAPADHHGFSRN